MIQVEACSNLAESRPMRLLVIEDDFELADGLINALNQSHHAAEAVHYGEEALARCAIACYDLVLVDLGLPDCDGIALIRRLRSRGMLAPILILTARDDLQDRIAGLDAGADDYLTKPFALGELEARIRALLRRGASTNLKLCFGRIEFDPGSRELIVEGAPVTVTARELAVLELLLRGSGRVVSKEKMIESLYTWDQDANSSMIEVFVSRLRRKLERANAGVEIRALRGLGYRLQAQLNAQ